MTYTLGLNMFPVFYKCLILENDDPINGWFRCNLTVSNKLAYEVLFVQSSDDGTCFLAGNHCNHWQRKNNDSNTTLPLKLPVCYSNSISMVISHLTVWTMKINGGLELFRIEWIEWQNWKSVCEQGGLQTWFSYTSSVRRNGPTFTQLIVGILWKATQNV
jgi:hypothetical protein